MPKIPTPPSTNNISQKITKPAEMKSVVLSLSGVLLSSCFLVLTSQLYLASEQGLNESEELGGILPKLFLRWGTWVGQWVKGPTLNFS